MEKAYLFLDVDGTIVDYEGNLPQSCVDAIRQARNNGHEVFAVTGRSKAEMYQHILDIGFDGYIGGNGSYVEYHDQAVVEQTLSLEDCKKIVDWLNDRGLAFFLECNAGLFASPTFETDALKPMGEYSARKGHGPLKTVRDAFPEMIFDASDFYRSDVNKISFVLKTYDDYLLAKEIFADYQVGTWGGAGETALFGDIARLGITKATAIDALLKYLEVPNKNTYGFGDAKIDIPMLEYCTVGVAVESGGDEIKAMTDYITDAVDQDGIYKAFKHFKLI